MRNVAIILARSRWLAARRDGVQERRVRRRARSSATARASPPTRRPAPRSAARSPMLDGDQCVPMFPPTVCDPTTTTMDTDPTTGVTTCIGTGGGGCTAPFACPTPGRRQADDLRPDLRLRDQPAVRRRPSATGAKCSATARRRARARSQIQAYDAIAFGMNPHDRAAARERRASYIDDCGRYRVKDITLPSRAVHRPRHRRRDTREPGPARRHEHGRRRDCRSSRERRDQGLRGVDRRSRRRRTCGRRRAARRCRAASTSACSAAARRSADRRRCTGDAFDTATGVTFTKSGTPEPADDYYFTATETTHQTIDRRGDGDRRERHRPAHQRVGQRQPGLQRQRRPPDRRLPVGDARRRVARRTSCSSRSTGRSTDRHRRAPSEHSRRSSLCALGACRRVRRSDERRRRALFRASYDTERHLRASRARGCCRSTTCRSRSWSATRKSPLDVAVPGIGAAAGDTARTAILDYVVTLDMAFGMSLTDRVAIGLDVAGVSHRDRRRLRRARPLRGRRQIATAVDRPDLAAPAVEHRSVGEPERPDRVPRRRARRPARRARSGSSSRSSSDPHVAVDRGRLGVPAVRRRRDAARRSQPRVRAQARVRAGAPIASTRRGSSRTSRARIRERTVLEGYDTMDPMATPADAKVFLDVGSELVVGVGGVYELTPRARRRARGAGVHPAADALSLRRLPRCTTARRCSAIDAATTVAGAKHGDLTVLATLGMMVRVSADVTANLMIGTGQLGARGDDFRVTTGLVWAPQPAGAAAPGRDDRDGDGIPDARRQVPRRARGQGRLPGRGRLPRSRQRRRRHPRRARQVPERARGQGRLPGRRRLPRSRQRRRRHPRRAATSARTSRRTRTASRTTTAAPIPTTTATASPTRTTSARTSPRPSTASRTTTAAPTCAATTGPEERADRIDLKGAADRRSTRRRS